MTYRDIKTETTRHREMFEFYCSLEPGRRSRSFKKVAERFGITSDHIGRVAQAFDWRHRSLERDDRRQRAVEERMDVSYVVSTIDRLQTIDGFIKVGKELIEKAEAQIAVGKLKIASIYELTMLLRSMRDLIELEQILTGHVSPAAQNFVQQINNTYIGMFPDGTPTQRTPAPDAESSRQRLSEPPVHVAP